MLVYDIDSGVEVMSGRALLWWGLLCPALAVPRLPAPHYIQTDTGDQRFFQFSSGPGGQFRSDTGFHGVCVGGVVLESEIPVPVYTAAVCRREVRGEDGTVVGRYSWRDGRGVRQEQQQNPVIIC